MASMKTIEKGLARFVDYEIMSNVPNGSWQKLVAGTAVALGIKNLGTTLMGYKDNPLIKMNIFNALHNVCLDTFCEYKSDSVKHCFNDIFDNPPKKQQ